MQWGCSRVALGAVVLPGWAPIHRVFFSFCCSMQKLGPGASTRCPPGEPGPKQSPQIKPSEVVHDPGNRHMLVLIPFHGPKQEAETPRFKATQLRRSKQDSNLDLLESNSLTEVLWGFPCRSKQRETGVQTVPTRCPAQRLPQPPGDRGGGMWPQMPIRTPCFTL